MAESGSACGQVSDFSKGDQAGGGLIPTLWKGD
jgi:hypothetical protein